MLLKVIHEDILRNKKKESEYEFIAYFIEKI